MIIKFEIAKLAKEKGFDAPVPHCYCHNTWEDKPIKYDLVLFNFLLGGEGLLSKVFEKEKTIRNFEISDIINESDVYFNYNQDIRRLITRIYNGEEFMDDEKCNNMSINSFTHANWSEEEAEKNKTVFPNYNDGDFDWDVYNDLVSAPTQAMLQRWLREEKNIGIFVAPQSQSICDPEPLYTYILCRYVEDEYYCDITNYDNILHYTTYEEALEGALQSALRNHIV